MHCREHRRGLHSVRWWVNERHLVLERIEKRGMWWGMRPMKGAPGATWKDDVIVPKVRSCHHQAWSAWSGVGGSVRGWCWVCTLIPELLTGLTFIRIVSVCFFLTFFFPHDAIVVFKLFIYFIFVCCGFCCIKQVFSGCTEWGLLSSSHLDSFSCCGSCALDSGFSSSNLGVRLWCKA